MSLGVLFKTHNTPKTSIMPTIALPKLEYFDFPLTLSRWLTLTPITSALYLNAKIVKKTR